MAENKTQPTSVSVIDFLETLKDQTQKSDSLQLVQIIKEITGHKPVMWGGIASLALVAIITSMLREEKAIRFLPVFLPEVRIFRYILAGFERHPEILANLGKYKTSKSCLYIKRLSNVDLHSLRQLIAASYEHMNTKYNR